MGKLVCLRSTTPQHGSTALTHATQPGKQRSSIATGIPMDAFAVIYLIRSEARNISKACTLAAMVFSGPMALT